MHNNGIKALANEFEIVMKPSVANFTVLIV